MSSGAFLIAEREFRTYVATLSFWLALAAGPLLTAAVFALAPAAGSSATVAVAIHAEDPVLARSALVALSDAGRLESRHFRFVAKNERASLTLQRIDNAVMMRFSSRFPLTAEGHLLVARTLERNLEEGRASGAHGQAPLITVREAAGNSLLAGGDDAAASRFVMVAILWLTLTGSLGMLLQAVVRERANRALEGLLSAVRPWEIMAGKLVGVGAISALVFVVWLGCMAALSALAPRGEDAVSHVLAHLASPASLLRAAAIYLLAWLFFGTVTFGLGAAARDVSTAQNLSRPMFAVLLAAFFVALACAFGARESWLLYVPPFTPFLLLMHAPTELSAASQLEAVGLVLLATAAAGWLAIGRLTVQNIWAARNAQA
ncbi:MAG TPA: ABC transporter permease [Rhizomicrobium sp.]|nr:ABC transporter permease [Rhizomicrobium sp.]